MRIKNGILLLLIFAGTAVFAADSAIIRRNYYPQETSAIRYSNSAKQSQAVKKYDAKSLELAIKELEAKLKKNPDNSSLRIYLADLCIKSKQYTAAYNNFQYLYYLKKTNKLNDDAISAVGKMFEEYKNIPRKESGLCLNMAVMALILDNDSALDYAIAGAEYTNDDVLVKATLQLLIDSNQNPTKAVNICERILARNPNDIEVRRIKAAFNVKNNQIKEAIYEYSKLLTMSPNDDTRYSLYELIKSGSDKEVLKKLYGNDSQYNMENAYVSLTDLLLQYNDMDGAKHYAQTLVKKYKQNPNGYLFLSEIYKSEGKVKEAYDILKQAADKADNSEAVARYNVLLAKLSDEPVKEANSLIENGLYEQALQVLDSANPEILNVILAQAKANYLLGNKQPALDFLNKAMSLYKENSDVYSAFADIYLREKDTETARKYINKSLAIYPDNTTAKKLLNSINKADAGKYTASILDAIEAQNYTEAMRLIDEAISIDDNSADLYYYKSIVLIALNNYKDASTALYKCIDIDKNYTDAYFYLAASLDTLGESKIALSYYKKFINMTKGNEIGKTERIQYAQNRIQKLEK